MRKLRYVFFFTGIVLVCVTKLWEQLPDWPWLLRKLAPDTARLWVGLEELRDKSGVLKKGQVGFQEVVGLAERIGFANLSAGSFDTSAINVQGRHIESVEWTSTLTIPDNMHGIRFVLESGKAIYGHMEILDTSAWREFEGRRRLWKELMFWLGLAMSVTVFVLGTASTSTNPQDKGRAVSNADSQSTGTDRKEA